MASDISIEPAAIPRTCRPKAAFSRARRGSVACAVTAALALLPEISAAAEEKARIMVSATVVSVCRVDIPIAAALGDHRRTPTVDCGGTKTSKANSADVRFRVCRQSSTEPECAHLLDRFPGHEIMTVRFD